MNDVTENAGAERSWVERQLMANMVHAAQAVRRNALRNADEESKYRPERLETMLDAVSFLLSIVLGSVAGVAAYFIASSLQADGRLAVVAVTTLIVAIIVSLFLKKRKESKLSVIDTTPFDELCVVPGEIRDYGNELTHEIWGVAKGSLRLLIEGISDEPKLNNNWELHPFVKEGEGAVARRTIDPATGHAIMLTVSLNAASSGYEFYFSPVASDGVEGSRYASLSHVNSIMYAERSEQISRQHRQELVRNDAKLIDEESLIDPPSTQHN